jgi:[ribosomal protein S5]-alanine N-acetyltransferase
VSRFLIGQKVSLHALSEKDEAADAPYFRWLDDLELDRYSGRSRFSNTIQRHKKYLESARGDGSLLLLGIYERGSEKHVGNISLKEIDRFNRRGWLGYMIGDRESQGKGYATEAVRMFVYYLFLKMNMVRVYTTVATEHAASIKVLERAGLEREGTLRSHILVGSAALDCFMYAALADEWTRRHGGTAEKHFENRWWGT